MHKFLFPLILIVSGISVASAVTRTSVINSYPVNGASYVNPFTNIGVTFSDALSLASLSEDNISVFINDSHRSGKLHLSADRRTLIFVPDESFPLGSSIRVEGRSFRTVDGAMTEPFHL